MAHLVTILFFLAIGVVALGTILGMAAEYADRIAEALGIEKDARRHMAQRRDMQRQQAPRPLPGLSPLPGSRRPAAMRPALRGATRMRAAA